MYCSTLIMVSNVPNGKLTKNGPQEKLPVKISPQETLSEARNSQQEKFPHDNILQKKLLTKNVLQEKLPTKNPPTEKFKAKKALQGKSTKNPPPEKLSCTTLLPFIMLFILLNLNSEACGSPSPRRRPRQTTLSDSALLDLVQRQCFRYFWDYGHPVSGLARERTDMGFGKGEVVTTGGSGFGLMTLVVAAERGWVTRDQAAMRTDKILQFLSIKAERFNGIFPHWMNGTSGKMIKFDDDDNAGDLVETSFMVQGMLTVRQYFNGTSRTEQRIRSVANRLWREVVWTRHMPVGKQVLTWDDPHQPGIDALEITGWHEALITYFLAASSPTNPISAAVYHQGWADNGSMKNGKDFYGIRLPLGSDYGGPLFFSHYSFLGLDPKGLKDKYADYWAQNVNHTLINYEHCRRNPKGFKGYSGESWGLTASTSPDGYTAHSPTNDVGTIAPTAALSSFPYTPTLSMTALRHFYQDFDGKLWGQYGFIDAFNVGRDWYAQAFLAIDQGPIILMIENQRTGLLWKLFMSCPEVKVGLKKLGFQSPYLITG